jgi:hypothetical protein
MKSANQTPETAASRNLRETRDSLQLAFFRIARMQDRTANQQSKEN